MTGRRASTGYILLETLTALTVLSVSVLAMNAALRQSVQTRALARDYTEARFLMEHLLGAIEVLPRVEAGTTSGVFQTAPRFQYEYIIDTVEVPAPAVSGASLQRASEQLGVNPDELELPVPFIPRVKAVVRWSRGGREHEAVITTLLDPNQMPEMLQQGGAGGSRPGANLQQPIQPGGSQDIRPDDVLQAIQDARREGS